MNTSAAHTRIDLRLAGCASTPLSSYLKALAVLRLVGEQVDPLVTGRWEQEEFILSSCLDENALEEFLCHRYIPSPIVAPWNGKSGFYPGDNQEAIETLLSTASTRFSLFREVIAISRSMIASMGLEESPKKETKAELVMRLRGELPDAALRWLDAAMMLSEEDLKYPPLLGTGGNDGRLDFTNNFMQRLADVMPLDEASNRSRGRFWLRGALWGEATPLLQSKAIGQLAPGSAGGPNGTSGFIADSLINPWDFILAIEGAALLSVAATRRFQTSDRQALSFPFTVRAAAAGAGHTSQSDEAKARAEIWMPLWQGAASLAEVNAMFTEGRATLGRKTARDGLSFARAVARLGVDRGIDAFERYGFLQRSGKAFLAVPLGRIEIKERSRARLINDLDRKGWLESLRHAAKSQGVSAGFTSLIRRLEDALFDLARTDRDDRRIVQRVLVVLGEIQHHVARSPKAREQLHGPVPRLRPDWILSADDGSDAFRLAAALASIHGRTLTLRQFVFPVTADGRAWEPESRLVVWTGGDLIHDMLAVLDRMLLESRRTEEESAPFLARSRCDARAVAAFLHGQVDLSRVSRLLSGICCAESPSALLFREDSDAWLPAAYTFLKRLFTPVPELVRLDLLPEGQSLPIPLSILRRLASGVDSEGAMETARRRLRASGLPTLAEAPSFAGIHPRRLAASMLIPIAQRFRKKTGVALASETTEQGD